MLFTFPGMGARTWPPEPLPPAPPAPKLLAGTLKAYLMTRHNDAHAQYTQARTHHNEVRKQATWGTSYFFGVVRLLSCGRRPWCIQKQAVSRCFKSAWVWVRVRVTHDWRSPRRKGPEAGPALAQSCTEEGSQGLRPGSTETSTSNLPEQEKQGREEGEELCGGGRVRGS